MTRKKMRYARASGEEEENWVGEREREWECESVWCGSYFDRSCPVLSCLPCHPHGRSSRSSRSLGDVPLVDTEGYPGGKRHIRREGTPSIIHRLFDWVRLPRFQDPYQGISPLSDHLFPWIRRACAASPRWCHSPVSPVRESIRTHSMACSEAGINQVECSPLRRCWSCRWVEEETRILKRAIGKCLLECVYEHSELEWEFVAFTIRHIKNVVTF